MSQFSRAASLPLLETAELLRSGLPKTRFGVSLRDFIEWNNMMNARSYNFFAKRPTRQRNEVGRLQPLLSHCMARWLHVEYKLNYYPYYDLNVVSIYTDLHEAIENAEQTVNYFKNCSNDDVYGRLNYYLVPLYDTTTDAKSLARPPSDPKIRIMKEGILSNYGRYKIEDPVFVTMVNDVIKYLPCDLVQYNDDLKKWQQAYIEYDPVDGFIKQEFREMDYWCHMTAKLLQLDQGYQGSELYITTRLVNLFMQLHQTLPEHKLFIIDDPQRWLPSVSTIIKMMMGWKTYPITQANISTDLYKPWNKENFPRRESSTFITDFSQVKSLYTETTEGSKTLEAQDLRDFANEWMDIKESIELMDKSGMSAEYVKTSFQPLNETTLGVIRG
ncbi:Protein arginine methyltransferase NDUFAF7 [Kluyveromyces marxianus]